MANSFFYYPLGVVSCFVSGEEFYADGMPMCAHRSIVAGTENGNETAAESSKVLGYCHKIVQGH